MATANDAYQPSSDRQRDACNNREDANLQSDIDRQQVLEVIAELDRAVSELRKSAIRG